MQGAVIDGHGECCAGGAVDACGACGGSALLVDANYFCCNSGVLDSGQNLPDHMGSRSHVRICRSLLSSVLVPCTEPDHA